MRRGKVKKMAIWLTTWDGLRGRYSRRGAAKLGAGQRGERNHARQDGPIPSPVASVLGASQYLHSTARHCKPARLSQAPSSLC